MPKKLTSKQQKEQLVDKYNNAPIKEQLVFMSIEQRYRNKK